MPQISGGVEAIDGDSPETAAEAAAVRELREETGLHAGQLIHILDSYPNPATHSNRVISFIALDLEPLAQRSLDATETIEVFTDEFSDILFRLPKR
jgi:8-oxo-dGTP pyrophosphatase MutT (NUDIX family)